MIRDVAELEDGAALQAEVAVVGAGFAGIDLARNLGSHGVRVTLLESGRADFDPQTQTLTRVHSVGKPLRAPDRASEGPEYLPPIFRGEARLRQFGGTSNIWTGKWRRFDSPTFERRGWIPDSGWPIGRDELDDSYAEVARDYGLADFDGFAGDAANRRLDEVAGAAGLKPSLHYWQKQPLRLSTFLPELRRSTGIEVLVGANATEIVLAENLEHVEKIVFRSLDGRRFTLSAAQFVIATGGLEAPRLLLASNRQVPGGVGNARDLVGRFYMDHPKHKRGKLWPGPGLKPWAERVATYPRPRFHMSLSLSADVQRRESLLNHSIFLSPRYRYLDGYPTESIEAIRAALRARDGPRLARSALALAASPRDLGKVLERGVHRDSGGPLEHYRATMYVEQAPSRESRVYLGTERDALGMPELVVDWRLTELDHEVFGRLLDRLPTAFAAAGLGRLDFGPEPLTLDDTDDAAHHIGATRMAETPAEGVVDRDCKVFGTDNLFVAAASVFPTGDSSTPTYTIVALARRLGAHIRGLPLR